MYVDLLHHWQEVAVVLDAKSLLAHLVQKYDIVFLIRWDRVAFCTRRSLEPENAHLGGYDAVKEYFVPFELLLLFQLILEYYSGMQLVHVEVEPDADADEQVIDMAR